jgi:formate dehydrogenase subunit delta
MANDIAANLTRMPGQAPEEAVADHLLKFWDPRMRAELLGLVDDPSLSDVVVKAIRLTAASA